MTAMAWSTYSGADLAGWLVSEKFDGARAQWDGARLVSKSGRVINAPEWFTAGLPALALDGEIYAGPGTLDRVQGLSRRAAASAADWLGVRFCVFDAPGVAGGFAQRLDALGRTAHGLPVHVEIVRHEPCPGRAWLAARFAAVVAAGGEGLVARHPAGEYRAGERSQWVAKIKQHPDSPFLIGHSGEEIAA
ncbi:hypothetical protein [Acidiphilium sp.]|uniref:ATP-dependent DNA ligase n=1 Tax=Acidiphilium sp. TaxID=527 RepID=UPI00258CDB34|nr:hypothetical protein [Acidiphilium sp.]